MLTNVSYILTAPSAAPTLDQNIHHSQVELSWNEIPLKHRNGIIRGYTLYIWNDINETQGIQGFKEVHNRFSDFITILLTIMFLFFFKL